MPPGNPKKLQGGQNIPGEPPPRVGTEGIPSLPCFPSLSGSSRTPGTLEPPGKGWNPEPRALGAVSASRRVFPEP